MDSIHINQVEIHARFWPIIVDLRAMTSTMTKCDNITQLCQVFANKIGSIPFFSPVKGIIDVFCNKAANARWSSLKAIGASNSAKTETTSTWLSNVWFKFAGEEQR
jgi:hypothetical protein